MNFEYSQDQIAIKDVADRMFRDLCGDEQIKQIFKSDAPLHAELWQQLGQSGLIAAPLPSQYGGSDMGLTELCMVIEAQGNAVAPVPLVETAVECAMPIAQFASEELKRRVLPAVASGESILAALRPYSGLQALQPLTATAGSNGWVLNGSCAVATYAPLAQGFLVTAQLQGGGHWIGFCAAKNAGVKIVLQKITSGESAGQVHFNNVNIATADTIAMGDEAEALLEWQAQRVYTAQAAQQVGVLQQGLKRAADYLNQRTQFGRSLSSFQAVAQQAADAYMAVEALRGVYWRALDDIEKNADTIALSSRVAKFWIAEAGHVAAHIFLHLHGGIGQDLDYPLHRFFTWAKKNELLHGTANMQSAALGELIRSNPQAVA